MLTRGEDDSSGRSICWSSFGSIARDFYAPRSLPYRLFRSREVMSGIDQRNMRKRLGEITYQSLGPGDRILLGQEVPISFLSVRRRSNKLLCFRAAPLPAGCLPTKSCTPGTHLRLAAGHRGFRRCHSAAQGHPLVNVSSMAAIVLRTLGSSGGKKPPAGMSSKLASKVLLSPIRLHKSTHLGVKCSHENRSPRGFARAKRASVRRTFEAAILHTFDGAVESHPGHDL